MRLRIAIGRYDRTQAMLDGRIAVEGVETTLESPPLRTLFTKAFDFGEYDVAELSCSNYVYLTSRGDCRYKALPIFPSRMFRHSAIYIRTDSGITCPRDLANKLVGVRDYSMTAVLVARGILQEEYGLAPEDMRWRYGPIDAADTASRPRVSPHGIELLPIGEDQNLSDLLIAGKLDALIAHRPPACFTQSDPRIMRLFRASGEIERDYFRRTGIFPIMHLIGVRNEYASDATLCRAVCNAFERSKQQALKALSSYDALPVSLPWLEDDFDRARATLGQDYWPYGITRNRPAINAIARQSFHQGIARRLCPVEELFAPGALDWEP